MSEAISGAGVAVSPGCRCAHPGYETKNIDNKKGGPFEAAFSVSFR
jgi:hypothetical protein